MPYDEDESACRDCDHFGTAKLNGLNPADWLKDALEKLPTWPNSRIDELPPFPLEAIKAQPTALR